LFLPLKKSFGACNAGRLFVAGSQELGCGGQLSTLKAITTVFLQVQKT
jgi:hypothetical protein